MTFVRASHRYAVITVVDSDNSGHHTIAEDISCLLARNFTVFIIDFKQVTKFNSHVLALLAGIYKVVTSAHGKLFISKMAPLAKDTLSICGLHLTTITEDDAQYLIGVDADGLREIQQVTL